MTVTTAVRDQIRQLVLERPDDVGAVLYNSAVRAAVERERIAGGQPLEADGLTLTPAALERFRDSLSELNSAAYEIERELADEARQEQLAQMDAERRRRQRYQRLVGGPFPRRRRFPRRELERYPLTQPENVCRRCGDSGGGHQELDHMMELVLGGPDHPHNLVRLCSRCHRSKPFISLPTFAECRLAVLAWVADYPARWRPGA